MRSKNIFSKNVLNFEEKKIEKAVEIYINKASFTRIRKVKKHLKLVTKIYTVKKTIQVQKYHKINVCSKNIFWILWKMKSTYNLGRKKCGEEEENILILGSFQANFKQSYNLSKREFRNAVNGIAIWMHCFIRI